LCTGFLCILEYEEFSNDILANTRSKYDQHGVHFTTERNIKQLRYGSEQPKPQPKPKNKPCNTGENNESGKINGGNKSENVMRWRIKDMDNEIDMSE
jgi:hypothetical protein